ncbi:hypothetical protein ACN28E_13875 [Archangium lansingense]|uniref:hypothetical protein n=1 Tax=Archangium lansingense TaxID=2995310 RepID=UPI003B7DE1E4
MAPLLAVVLAANPYSEQLWAKDLRGLVALLADPPVNPADAEQQALFGDVVRFLNCEPLPALNAEDRLHASRALLRLEEARRGRLGASAAKSDTVWRDVLSPDFFRRASVFAQGEVLRWPVEEERWSSEVLEVKLKAWSCDKPAAPADELGLLTPELLKEVDVLGPEASGRLLYHRASQLLARGKADEAREMAARLSPPVLAEELRPFAQLLRLALELEPREGYVSLAREPALASRRLPIAVQAAAQLSTEGRWQEVLALTEPYAQWPGSSTPAAEAELRKDLLYRRALAYQALGDREALLQAIAPVFPALASSQDPLVEALRGVMLASLARGALEPQSLALLKDLGPVAGLGRRMASLGSLALGVGNVRTALEVSERLLQERGVPSRARGFALRAEVALASGDAAGLTRSIERLLALRRQERVPVRDLEEVDRIALALAQTLVTASADLTEPRWRPLLSAQLERVREGVHSRHEKVFPALVAALEDRPPQPVAKGKRQEAFVAVGQVAVGAPQGTLPPPPFSVEWPEPYSLLALPLPDGSPRDWFPREPSTPAAVPAPTGAEVPHAP